MTPAQRLTLLEQLTRIHSGSGNAAGVDRVQEILRSRLEALGLEVRLEANPDPAIRSGKMLIATLAGHDPASVDLVTHADTVEPGQGPDSTFRLELSQGIAIGPGVMDDKAAQVMALESIERLLASLGGNKPARTIRFVSSPSEELGSPGFGPLLATLGREARVVLGLEPALEDGDIIDSRRGNRWYRIQVQGREAHSGRAHRHGINAAHELVRKLARIQELTDYSRELTVSVGSLRTGGDTYNVVPAHAEAKLDARFAAFVDRDQLHGEITRVLSEEGQPSPEDGARPQTRWSIEDDCPPFETQPAARALIDAYASILQKVEGRRPQARRGGGAADCCYMSRPGLLILDGLGPAGGRMHSPEEYVNLSSIESRAEALHQLLLGPLQKPSL